MSSVNWNNSIYIPTIYQSISKEDLWAYLEKNFGKISRIDFMDLNENCRRAFVHFSEWFSDKGMGKIARNKIETDGICDFIMPIPNKHRKWFQGKMLINKNPLSSTQIQVKRRLDRLENRIDFLEKKMKMTSYYDDKGPMDISELY